KHALLAGIFRWEKPNVLQETRCIAQQTAAPCRATMGAFHDLRLDSWRFVRLPVHRLNGANGMSDMEGKVTRVGASERGQRTSFKSSKTSKPLSLNSLQSQLI